MSQASENAAVDPSRDVSKEAMIFGILTKKILPGATVLGFSRSGDFINKDILDKKSEVFSLLDLTDEDIEELIRKHTRNPQRRKTILKQIKWIDRNQILFLMQMLKLQENQFGEITSATDLFLSILRGNLAFQNEKSDTSFFKLLKSEQREYLKKTFQLCKENLQKKDDGCVDPAGVMDGIVPDVENWRSSSGIELPLTFLKSVGIFEIPQSSFEELTLTAQHLSFVEFFAAVGILISEDIKAELEKIENDERVKAVSIYVRNIKLKINYLKIIFAMIAL